MNLNNFKMPIILIGNSFKYEIEATVKLFFPTDRFSFSDSIEDAVGDSYIVATVSESSNSSLISAAT